MPSGSASGGGAEECRAGRVCLRLLGPRSEGVPAPCCIFDKMTLDIKRRRCRRSLRNEHCPVDPQMVVHMRCKVLQKGRPLLHAARTGNLEI